jgi:hypothetical protein
MSLLPANRYASTYVTLPTTITETLRKIKRIRARMNSDVDNERQLARSKSRIAKLTLHKDNLRNKRMADAKSKRRAIKRAVRKAIVQITTEAVLERCKTDPFVQALLKSAAKYTEKA